MPPFAAPLSPKLNHYIRGGASELLIASVEDTLNRLLVVSWLRDRAHVK